MNYKPQVRYQLRQSITAVFSNGPVAGAASVYTLPEWQIRRYFAKATKTIHGSQAVRLGDVHDRHSETPMRLH